VTLCYPESVSFKLLYRYLLKVVGHDVRNTMSKALVSSTYVWPGNCLSRPWWQIGAFELPLLYQVRR
jgi:hypothetical protein